MYSGGTDFAGKKMKKDKINIFRARLRHLERELVDQMKQDNACFGVTVSQCHILVEIGAKEEISNVELSSVLNLDTSTLSRAIDGLVNIGLVDRKQNPNDRRYVSLSLTAQGKNLYTSIEESNNAYLDQLFQYIPEEKHEQVIEGFLLFSAAMNRITEKSRCCAGSSAQKGREEKP